MYVVYHLCAWCPGRSEEGPIELELQLVVNLPELWEWNPGLLEDHPGLLTLSRLSGPCWLLLFNLLFVLSLIYIFQSQDQ